MNNDKASARLPSLGLHKKPGNDQPNRFLERFHTETAAWIVLAVTLLITFFSWWLANNHIQKRAQDHFEFEVSEAKEAIQKRMLEYEQVLRGGHIPL